MAASINPNKDIFTTRDVSKLLQVNPRSVINWIEQKLLISCRTPGGHRRISREDLIAFLRKHQIPIPRAIIEEKLKVLIVDGEDSIVKVLTTCFAPVVQLDRTSDYESEGQRFESSRAGHVRILSTFVQKTYGSTRKSFHPVAR